MDRRDETEIAARVARRLGLAFTEAVVLYRGTNVLVHLRPTPVVARVTRLAHLVRPLSDLAGAMSLARSETMRGHVAAPTTLLDPGPHIEESRYVTFWAHYPSGTSAPLATPLKRARGYDSFMSRPERIRVAYAASIQGLKP